jgi:RNA polymerase sigma-70 factor (ECF subfamily)
MDTTAMDELSGPLPGTRVSDDDSLAREFESRLAECSTLAFRVAFGVLRHRQDAEDVAQEALTRAYRNLHALRDRDRFRAWLVRISWRLALDRQRSDRRRQKREQGGYESARPPSAEQVAAWRELEDRIWWAVDQLPEKLRVVLVLGAMEGHDHRELSRLLGVAEGTVKSRLHEARRKVAERLR